MITVQLKGRTLHGKNKIREHGSLWRVVRQAPSVQALQGARGMLLRAPDGDERWVRIPDDDHFEVASIG